MSTTKTATTAEKKGPGITQERPLSLKSIEVMAGSRGMVLTNMDEMSRFCAAVVASREFKDITTPEQCMIRLQAGLELGLSPIWSLTNILVINGRPSVWGDCMLGLVLSHPDCIDVVEEIQGVGEEAIATCTVTRKGRLPVKRTFTMEEAKHARLTFKDGPWKTFPRRMLQMRARAFALRDSFADRLRGLGVVEEQRDIAMMKRIEAREVQRNEHPMVLPDEPDLSGGGESRPAGEQKCDDPDRTGVASPNESQRRAESVGEQPPANAGSRPPVVSESSASPAQEIKVEVEPPKEDADRGAHGTRPTVVKTEGDIEHLSDGQKRNLKTGEFVF